MIEPLVATGVFKDGDLRRLLHHAEKMALSIRCQADGAEVAFGEIATASAKADILVKVLQLLPKILKLLV
jgi:hypothetical protein